MAKLVVAHSGPRIKYEFEMLAFSLRIPKMANLAKNVGLVGKEDEMGHSLQHNDMCGRHIVVEGVSTTFGSRGSNLYVGLCSGARNGIFSW
jgi:hypothetical protein